MNLTKQTSNHRTSSSLGLLAIVTGMSMWACGPSGWSINSKSGTATRALDPITADSYCTIVSPPPPGEELRCIGPGGPLQTAATAFCTGRGYTSTACRGAAENNLDNTKFAVLEFNGRTEYGLYEAFIDDRSIDRMELSAQNNRMVMIGTCTCSE